MCKSSCNLTTMNDRAERHRSVELGLGILGVVCVCVWGGLLLWTVYRSHLCVHTDISSDS